MGLSKTTFCTLGSNDPNSNIPQNNQIDILIFIEAFLDSILIKFFLRQIQNTKKTSTKMDTPFKKFTSISGIKKSS